jgi:hypothetical protein
VNDGLGKSLLRRYRDKLLIFGICGIVSVLADLDHIWKILGLEEPINLTYYPGRALHTTLVFILYGCIAGCIAFAYAHRQNLFRWSVGISKERVNGRVSFVCWNNNSYDCDNCDYKYICSKEVEMKWP